MEILSIFTAWEWISSIIDKITELVKWWKSKKEDEENREIIRSRLRSIFNYHKNEIESIFTDILGEMKSEILENKENNNEFLLNKIENLKKWDLIENIDKTGNEIENNKTLVFMWKTFFYDDKIKDIETDLKINTDKFINLYIREAKNYFDSNKEADIKLLLNEKKQILQMLEKSISEFEKIILVKLQGLVQLSIVDSIKPTSSINNDKITSMIKNTEKFANDIQKWEMKKYYKRMLNLFDIMINEMVENIKK